MALLARPRAEESKASACFDIFRSSKKPNDLFRLASKQNRIICSYALWLFMSYPITLASQAIDLRQEFFTNQWVIQKGFLVFPPRPFRHPEYSSRVFYGEFKSPPPFQDESAWRLGC
jgi:hypothetical protein